MHKRYWILSKHAELASRPTSVSTATAHKKAHATPAVKTKLFVLDTNVLMHDPTSLFRFEEHDIFLPIMTLEELDNNKKGVSEVARNARQASRYLDDIVSTASGDIGQGIPLKRHDADTAKGRLYLQTEAIEAKLPASLPTSKADNHIIGVVIALHERYADRHVILVS
jgi:PhoH-like ATPase